ncbi:orexin/Hypocretin receptor type 1-like [Planococcus citri]|uniref:orexin/Hypocretin receptor type 1-like n=1 Tax=Planococcus citri TaxID=170843 RepID=UPI0031F8C211
MSKIIILILIAFSNLLYVVESSNTTSTFALSLNYTSDEFSINDTNTFDADYITSILGGTPNCSNEYCLNDDDYIDLIIDHIIPTPFEWVLIAMHVITFIVGLVGNALVCIAVYKNRGMRNVTNYFIVNLAVADFMVILFCLPPTVVWDVTETWFMGTLLCKIVVYFQTVSVAVSVLTLTFISIDRWYAICFPLKFKSTTNRAKVSIICIWIVSLSADIPELVVLTTIRRQDIPIHTQFFTQCTADWSIAAENFYLTGKILLLYVFPLALMTFTYYNIVKVLWTSNNIPGHTETVKMMNSSGLYQNALNNRRIPTGSTTESQLRSRRKAAKMLVAVVIMFAICYFPVHLLNVLRNTLPLYQNDYTAALSNLTHWLCYANSAINPIIYNFMSGKFRREFKRAFQQCHHCGKKKRQPDIDLVSQNDYAHSSNRRTSQSYAFSSRRTKTTSFITHTT